MSKIAVIYNSRTGFTKRYAEWIAEAVGAECIELSAAKKRSFDGCDAIVFGGWAHAGSITKLAWFKGNIARWQGKKLVAFCVGGSPADNPEIEPALRKNFTDDEWSRVRVFYCPGGFCYERMSAGSKLMMKMFRKVLESNKNKTPSDELMIKMISSSYDISDKKYIEPIVEYLAE